MLIPSSGGLPLPLAGEADLSDEYPRSPSLTSPPEDESNRAGAPKDGEDEEEMLDPTGATGGEKFGPFGMG